MRNVKGGGLSRAPAPTFDCYGLLCRKIATLFADFTLCYGMKKTVQSFVLRHRFIFCSLFSACDLLGLAMPFLTPHSSL